MKRRIIQRTMQADVGWSWIGMAVLGEPKGASKFLQMSLICLTLSSSPSPSQRPGPDQRLIAANCIVQTPMRMPSKSLARYGSCFPAQQVSTFANSVNVSRTATDSLTDRRKPKHIVFRQASSSMHSPRQPRAK